MRNAYQLSQDEQVLQADPVELVIMMYRAAADAIRQSRQHLASGDITERGRQISRASALLTELAMSLNHEIGGALSRNLCELYDYLQRLLATAHAEQSDEKLAQAERLVETLLEGWNAARHEATPAPVPSAPVYSYAEPVAYQPVSYQF